MATTNVTNSTLFKLYTATGPAVAVSRLTDLNFSVNEEPRDITTKDSAGWRQLLEGLRSYEISGGGLIAFDDTNGGLEFEESVRTRTAIVWTLGTSVSGDPKLSGDGRLTSFELASPNFEDNVSFTFTMQGTGQYYVGTF